ncbi:hypothetical protein GCM10010885_10050 [Alicyclobacillus cellulosilyticus]|uniref:Small acid-soluble spore protein alpha/beta type n=1 Tax=Alicyclobacillus cellulosilyticus TaxID=1003997 RepID=A0A917NI78_9BACL|nr:small, acid-soluble spore protein, alpha/beta type [Alicyclobacillus cellulosilyticus]GGJ02705.1 hypothetical protein GCM10010885_10050 [Alicyclobacillus cellulosilyticus]
MRKRKQTHPELARLMERMREEVAREVGLDEVYEGYFGEATTAQCGRFGHLLRLRAEALLVQTDAGATGGATGADGNGQRAKRGAAPPDSAEADL